MRITLHVLRLYHYVRLQTWPIKRVKQAWAWVAKNTTNPDGLRQVGENLGKTCHTSGMDLCQVQHTSQQLRLKNCMTLGASLTAGPTIGPSLTLVSSLKCVVKLKRLHIRLSRRIQTCLTLGWWFQVQN